MKKLLFLSGTALLLLAACNNDDSSSDNKSASNVEDSQKSENSNKGDNSKSSSSKDSSNKESNSDSSKSSSSNDIANLSEKEKVALVFLANESGKYTLTKNDILTGRYTAQMSDGKETKTLKNFAVSREIQDIPNSPEGMKFYGVSPSVGMFGSIIGVSDDKIYLGGTQSEIPSYKDALKYGEEHDTKEVYEKYKDSSEFESVANKINVYDKMPTFSDDDDEESDDDSSSDDNSSSDSSSDSEEVTRDNVIDKVESYEGENLDTDEYTFKEPEKTSDGKWGFSYDDKDGNLAGSYTVDVDDGYVTKYDENGDKIGSGY